MSWYADINGELTTNPKALSLIMDLVGEWTSFDSDGGIQLQNNHSLTLAFIGQYRNLGRCLPEAVYKLVQKFPETTGEFSITSTDGCHYAATYRTAKGKLYRRTLQDAPEREVFLHEYKYRNVVQEVLFTEHELTRLVRAKLNGHSSKRRQHGKTRNGRS